VSSSASRRLEIASQVAAKVQAEVDAREVWLEGALAVGLAHAYSDIDLKVITDNADLVLTSRLVSGVRVDLAAATPDTVRGMQRLLTSFEVRFDDVERFRLVRSALGQLTRYCTAKRWTRDGWQPVATADELACYRLWAVADRVEHALSLTEDLLGLTADGLHAEAEVVCRQLETCLLGLEVAATGQPLLGDKWLPALQQRVTDASPLSPPPGHRDEATWFTATRHRVSTALLRCWPETGTTAVDPPPETCEVGWLPQRYTDGWFLRLADDRVQLTAGQFVGWLRATRQEP
jgi:hypothetical protein